MSSAGLSALRRSERPRSSSSAPIRFSGRRSHTTKPLPRRRTTRRARRERRSYLLHRHGPARHRDDDDERRRRNSEGQQRRAEPASADDGRKAGSAPGGRQRSDSALIGTVTGESGSSDASRSLRAAIWIGVCGRGTRPGPRSHGAGLALPPEDAYRTSPIGCRDARGGESRVDVIAARRGNTQAHPGHRSRA